MINSGFRSNPTDFNQKPRAVFTLFKLQKPFLVLNTRLFEFEDWQDGEAVRGDWQEVEDLEKRLDIQLGIEEEQHQRGFDLSL